MKITFDDIRAMFPALALMVGAFVAVAVGTLAAKEKRQGLAELVSYFALAFSLAIVFLRLFYGERGRPVAMDGFNHAIRLDELALFLSLAIIAATGLTVVLSADYAKGREIPHGEYYGLILLSASGMMVLIQSIDLITFFIALEILSLALYALVGLFRRDARSNEASIKYFVMGAFASGFLLYGMALLYGATGELSIDRIGLRVAQGAAENPTFVTLGFALLTIGLAFKVGAVPFHQWVPDVYEGAPTSVTAFMSVSVKAAGFGAVLRILLTAADAERGSWGPLIWALALATMIVGNLLALWQRSVKRMLAYSSIAHTGYILAAVASMRAGGTPARDAGTAAVFYLFVYTFMTLGAFAFLIYAGREGREAEDLDEFSGLAKRRPWAALTMTIFMVSLAGIPPTAGFFGKFMLFKAAIGAEEYALVIVGVLTSAVSVYYYLRVVVAMYMKPEPAEAPAEKPAFNVALVVFAAAAFTLALGILPSKYWHLSRESIRSLEATRAMHR